MADTRLRETLIGAATLGVLLVLLWSNAADKDEVAEGVAGYTLEAVFQRTDGLSIGDEVRMAGLEVGRVVGQTLDDSFRAHVKLRIAPDIAVPYDSAAIIETDGLLGSKYIEIQPGGAEDMLSPGDRFDYTQGSVVIEEMLAKIVSMAKAKRASSSAAADDGAAMDNDTVDGAAFDGADMDADGDVTEGTGKDTPFPSLLAPLPGEGGKNGD